MWTRRRAHYWEGMLAGAVGGLAGAYAMNRFQAAVVKVKGGPEQVPPPAAGRHGAQELKSRQSQEEPATVKAAVAVAETLDRELRPEEKGPAGNLVHYAFGAGSGAVYGLLAERAPATRSGYGALFGSALWLVSDEIAVPAFGLAKKPSAYPISTHVLSLASHLVYGVTAEFVRRRLRAL